MRELKLGLKLKSGLDALMVVEVLKGEGEGTWSKFREEVFRKWGREISRLK